MFSLIFYCGLISSVVSAHFNNDTSHDGDELDINTTLSTLASTTIPVSKDCVLEIKRRTFSRLVELFNSNLVNVVVMHFSFSNRTGNGKFSTDFHVTLSDPIGREILYILERRRSYSVFGVRSKFFSVGIKHVALYANKSQKNCVKRKVKFALENIRHIVPNLHLTTSYEICFYLLKVRRVCCQITKRFSSYKY